MEEIQNDSRKMRCGMCAMEIPEQARKCPYCHHFQNRVALISSHPAIPILIGLLMLAIMYYYVVTMFDQGENYEVYSDQIAVTESRLAFGDTGGKPTVAVIGVITNTTSIPWDEVHFHVDFRNAEGERVDVGHEEQYGYYLPATGFSSFKVSFRREFPKSYYSNHTVRVITAKDARGRW